MTTLSSVGGRFTSGLRCFASVGDALHRMGMLCIGWRCFASDGDVSHRLEMFHIGWRCFASDGDSFGIGLRRFAPGLGQPEVGL